MEATTAGAGTAVIPNLKEGAYRVRCERDGRTGMTIPPKLSLRSLLQFAMRPQWCMDYLLGEKFDLPNCKSRSKKTSDDLSSLAAFFASIMDRNITWERAEKLISYWGRPFAIKGIVSVDDARRAIEIGASAIIVSNHGGRQLDFAPPTLRVLPEIISAVKGQAEVLLDSGIRRGSDIVKAICLGARAVLCGRAYAYGLAAAGEAGVTRALEILRADLERNLRLLGCSSIAELDRSYVEIPHCWRRY